MSDGIKFIELLHKIKLRVEKSGTERTVGLIDALGPDCPYVRTSLTMFVDNDYEVLSTLIKEAGILIARIENDKES